MMCCCLRHGPAGDPGTWQGSDHDRPLTGDGKKRIAREAKAIADLDLGIQLVVTSPLVRARQTAKIVVDELDLRDALVEDGRVGLGFSPERLGDILRDHPKVRALMLVGHEPSMSQTIGTLIGGAEIDFKKGSLACVELTSDSELRGRLVWLAPPKLLTR
ncbi:MAG: histidine phosphatase family protein [Candidatus Aquilonibacter sp.]